MDLFFIIVFVIIVIIAFFRIIDIIISNNRNKQEEIEADRYMNGEMSEEEAKLYIEKLKAKEISEAQKVARKESIQKMVKDRKTIVKVIIVSNSFDSRKSFGSATIRGAIGGAVLGPAGLVGGALSGKNKVKNTTTFLIQYADGHRETKEVDNNSGEFNKLCQYLDM